MMNATRPSSRMPWGLRIWLGLFLACTNPREPSGEDGSDTAEFVEADTHRDSATDTSPNGTDTHVHGTDTADSGTATEQFVLDVSTELSGDGIAFRTNLPYSYEDCMALVVEGAPCEDLDRDELVDAWEDLVLDRFRPFVVFDESEPLMEDDSAVLSAVGRVSLAEDGSGNIRVYIMLGYSQDYGRCAISAHAGDSERVALDLSPIGDEGSGNVAVSQLYTAAHEGTEIDHGAIIGTDRLSLAEFPIQEDSGEPRWQVYASDGKHATYATAELCEAAEWLPCLNEDCAPDGVADPDAFRFLPSIVNAGEEATPLLSDLSSIGFPGDDAWADQDFCGGQDRNQTCSSAVREKLLVDPFE